MGWGCGGYGEEIGKVEGYVKGRNRVKEMGKDPGSGQKQFFKIYWSFSNKLQILFFYF